MIEQFDLEDVLAPNRALDKRSCSSKTHHSSIRDSLASTDNTGDICCWSSIISSAQMLEYLWYMLYTLCTVCSSICSRLAILWCPEFTAESSLCCRCWMRPIRISSWSHDLLSFLSRTKKRLQDLESMVPCEIVVSLV